MFRNFKKIEIVFVIVGFLISFGSVLVKAFTQSPFLTFLSLFIGSIMILVVLIEAKIDRMNKGIFLIGYAIFFGSVMPDIIFSDLIHNEQSKSADTAHENKKYSGILFEIDTYKNLIIYLCAGAGGSIIAAHADKFTTDKQSDINNESEFDVNNRHKELNNKI